MKNTMKEQLGVGDLVRWVEVDDPKINRLRQMYGTGPFYVVSVLTRDDSGLQRVKILIHCVDAEENCVTVAIPMPTGILNKVEMPPVEVFAEGDQVYFRELPENMKSREFRDEEGKSLSDRYGAGPFDVSAVQWDRSSRPGFTAHPQWVSLGADFQISGFFLTKRQEGAKKMATRKCAARPRHSKLAVKKCYEFGWWAWQAAGWILSGACLSAGVILGAILAEVSYPGVGWIASLCIIMLALVSLVPVFFCWMFCESRSKQYEYYEYRLPE